MIPFNYTFEIFEIQMAVLSYPADEQLIDLQETFWDLYELAN